MNEQGNSNESATSFFEEQNHSEGENIDLADQHSQQLIHQNRLGLVKQLSPGP